MNDVMLAELQLALQDFLLDKQSSAEHLTLETAQFSRHERLNIYHEAYRLRLIDALRNDFPALEQFLGEDIFAELMTAYIAQYPSQHTSLRWIGANLARFLRDHANWQQNIHAIEMAEFEWAQTTAFDAADEPSVTLDDVRALRPEQWMSMKLGFHPSLQLLHFFSNTPALWSGLIKAETLAATEIADAPQAWLVWREDLQVVYRPLDKPEAECLQAFIHQKNFSDVCEDLCEWFAPEQVPMQAAQFLQQWIRGGLVAAILAY